MNIPRTLIKLLPLAVLVGASVHSAAASSDFRGHWQMDDGVDRIIADSSGHGNDGKTRDVRWAEGVHNGAIQLNRIGFDCGNDASLNIDDAISIDAWVKPWNPRYPEEPTILSKEGSYALHLGPKKSASFTLKLNGKQERVSAEMGEWPSGQWRYLAGTFDGKTMKIYVNGKLAAEKPVAAGAKISQSKSKVYIGSANQRKLFAGTLDEIRIAAEAFTADEVIDTFRKGMFDVSRKQNKFTAFYEKYTKRDGKTLVPGTLWIDTEDFDDYGGWWMDTQFVPQMGSPYLMAAGLYEKVENAKTTVEIPEAGKYRLWVRSKNWLARGYTPGEFNVLVNGKKASTVFGAAEQRAWIWQDGGTYDLSGSVELELEDLTGWYGRCDAIILTRDMEFTPKQEQKDYLTMRKRFIEEAPAQDMGHYDVIIVGAGVAGCNAAIAAARGGSKVALIQDRPMVGGNNSSEMGVPVSGGSSIGKGRETGLNEEAGRVASYNYNMKWAAGVELLLAAEPNISIFLNSHVFKAETDENNAITAVTAFNMIDGHLTRYSGDVFADCTGDGWLGFYAGAEFMLGRESKEMFGEKNAKPIADNITMSGSLMQHSILGYQAIDMGEPVEFKAEPWFYDMRKNDDAYTERPRWDDRYRAGTWWTENQGDVDDLWDPEWARDDLLLCSLSFYEWIKNASPLAEKAANYRLTYIPVTNAKRETRRLVGDHVVTEQDIVNRVVFPDRVGYFVWKLDVHHPRGIFSMESPYDYETNISPASIPLSSMYSKNVPNMFMAGRHTSVTHVALGSSRVQGTTGMMGQAIGSAAAMCVEKDLTPRELAKSHMTELQQLLLKDDMTIVHVVNEDPKDLARTATATASSSQTNDGPENAINGLTRPVDDDWEMWIGKVPNNMWISDPEQSTPQWLELDFGSKKKLNSVYLTFDTDLKAKRYISWEHKLEERMPPQCAKDYRVEYHNGSDWVKVAGAEDNYQRRRIHRFDTIETSKIRVVVDKTNGDPSARIYEVRAYNE